MKVTVKDSKGTAKQLEMAETQTVAELKARAAGEFGIEDIQTIKLIFKGKLLADDKSLAFYEIKEASLIMIMAVKKSLEQTQNEKDYEDHKAVGTLK